MYPNSALSAGEMAIIAVVTVACLAVWIASVFIAARPPRRQHGAVTASLGQGPAITAAAGEAAERKAA
jgi:hypothetical protein